MALKYSMAFLTFQGHQCRVDFEFADYSGGVRYLNPGPRAFVLREFNNDGDFFKTFRAQSAEIQILADTRVELDDFVRPDETIIVKFYFQNTLFWQGYIAGDDLSEEWTVTPHYISLTAYEGYGELDNATITPASGRSPILEIIGLTLDKSILSLNLAKIICNLYYEGMLDKDDGNNIPLTQCEVDGKTFEGDTAKVILDKICKAWNLTAFQYEGVTWLVRFPEYLDNPASIKGIVYRPLLPSNLPYNKRFDVQVSHAGSMQLITSNAIRTLIRPFNDTRIEYKIEYPRELFCNQFFLNGTLILPTTNTFTIDCWTLLKGSVNAPAAGTTDWYRIEEKDIDDNITDNYVYFEKDTTQHWMKSEAITLNQDDKIIFSVDFRAQGAAANGQANIAIAMLQFEPFTGSTYYTLNDDGDWIPTNTSYLNAKRVNMSYADGESLLTWKNREVRTKGVPVSGRLYISLFNVMTSNPFRDANFKGLEVEIRESTFIPGVVGDFDKYSLGSTSRKNYLEQTFLDDSNNRSHKGALFFEDDLTGDNWYRMNNPTERLTFKRHKAISHMIMNRRHRNKLDVNMLGITWNDGGTIKPIGFMNTFEFVDDLPGVQWMILNLQELDFVNGQWRATLIEVYDPAKDDGFTYPEHTFGNIYK